MSIQSDLFEMRDEKYKTFHARLIPTVAEDSIIGVRVPELRKYAAKISGSTAAETFLRFLPHEYYEENNLHAFLVERVRDFDTAVRETERFLPYVDNWATCDMFVPKAFLRNKSELLPYIMKWLKSDKTYTVRYGIGLLMKLYMKEDFSPEYPKAVAEIKSEEYYVNMMIAWYFATALASRYDEVADYIKSGILGTWVTNKTIQKAAESRRVPENVKKELKKIQTELRRVR